MHPNCNCSNSSAEVSTRHSIHQDSLDRREACQRLLLSYTERIIGDMAGFIPLSIIGERILSEFSNEQFGHFKSSLVGLLSAYNYELSILQASMFTFDIDTKATAFQWRHVPGYSSLRPFTMVA